MRRIFSVLSVGISLLSVVAAGAAERVVLNDPEFPFFHATGMDQPRLYGILTDNGEVMGDENGPVLIRAFIDTGSSGFVLSNLHTDGAHDVGSLGLGPSDYIGVYTNTGIGGEELGSVSRPFGIRLYNEPFPEDGNVAVDDFVDYGEHNLWVRNQPGTGEVTIIDLEGGFQYPLISPVNIVGMPVIRQRVMVMEWLDVPEELLGLLPEEAKEIRTKLLPAGDPGIPPHNVTFDLAMRDFVGEAPPGEVLPGMSRNPVVRNVTISHDPEFPSVTADWLFDTGAGSSFIGFGWAKEIGLIPATYESLEEFLIDHEAAGGLVSEIGGIGEDSVGVPILELAELSIPAREGFVVVWENVRVHVFDHPELAALGLEGIFGMNLIGPAATIDASLLGNMALGDNEMLLLLLLMLSDVTPTPFRSIAFEVTGEETGELRLFREGLEVGGAPAVGFGEWVKIYFDEEERGEPSISGAEADPDGDGIPNLLEYAFGSSPVEAGRERLPEAEVLREDGLDYLSMSYFRSVSAEGLEFVVEVSTDMLSWAAAETVLVSVVSGDGFERVTVREREPLGGESRRFLRLRVVAGG